MLWNLCKRALTFTRVPYAASFLVAGAQVLAAQTPNQQPERDLKIFEAAVNLTNTLAQWALVMIGGSILAILSTSYYRPKSIWFRSTYFIFLPAWLFLSLSLYAGTRVQSVYLAVLYANHPDPAKISKLIEALNTDAAHQINRMEIGLLCFGIWLLVYLSWWIFNKEQV